MSTRFNTLPVATSLGSNNEFLVDQNGLIKRVAYNTFETSIYDRASTVAVNAVNAVSGNLQSEINTLQTSVNELTSNLAIVSNIAQGALGGGVTKTSAYTLIGETSAALRDDVTSIRTALAEETSLRAAGSAVLRDDITSIRTNLAATSAALLTLIQEETSLRVAGSAALRDDITSIRTALGNTSAALRSDITSIKPEWVNISTLPSYDVSANLNNWITDTGTTGVVRGADITSVGPGLVYCSSGLVLIRNANNIDSQLAYGSIAGASVSVNASGTNYIYINNTGGNLSWTQSPTVLSDVFQNVLVGVVFGQDDRLHVSDVNIPTQQTAQLLSKRLALVNGVTRQTGLVVSETGTRNIAQTAGAAWLALDQYSLPAFDSSGADTFTYYYQDGAGGVTEVTGQTQINNTQYDDGSGTLATLANNQYGVHWVYRGIDGDMYVVYGTSSYTLSEAQEATTPTVVPLQLSALHAVLCAKIIILKSASTFTEVDSAFDTVFPAGNPATHNDLGGLDGGATGEYYHLTSAQYTEYTSITGVVSKQALELANSVARLDADNNFQSNKLTNYFWDVETTTGAFTLTSALSGKLIYINNGATSINLNLVKDMPAGWNLTLVQGGTGVINVSAQASSSLVNASAHTALNNQYSGVVLGVVNQEGANSHAWYWLQGETQ